MSRHLPLRRSLAAAACLVAAVSTTGVTACSSKTKSAADTTMAVQQTAPVETEAPTTAFTPTGPPDPCSLVSQNEASKLVNVAMDKGVKNGQDDNLVCQFNSQPPGTLVEIYSGSGGHKSFQIDHDTLGHEFTKLDGIGDEAWLEDDNVFIHKGDNWVQIHVVALDLSEDQIRANLTDLAKSVADKL